MISFSLACASRSRPEMMHAAIESAIVNADLPGAIEVVLRVDRDDERLEDYKTMVKSLGHPVNLIIGERTIIGAAPYINEAAMACSGEIVLQFTDDLLCRTASWDTKFADVASRLDPKEPAAFIYDEKWATHGNPAVNRAWLNRAGCFYPADSTHFFVDTILFEVARLTGRLHSVPICIQHLKAKNDPLYCEIRKQVQNVEVAKAWRESLLGLMR